MKLTTTAQDFPIPFTTVPGLVTGGRRWCGDFPQALKDDDTIIGYDDPEDTFWRLYFPVGMRLEQMMYLYWKMRNFDIEFSAGSMESNEDQTNICGEPPDEHEVTQNLESNDSFPGQLLHSSDDTHFEGDIHWVGESYYRPEDDTYAYEVSNQRHLICMTARKLRRAIEDITTIYFESFDCAGKTSDEFTADVDVNFHLFDPYSRPTWMYSSDTGLYYPALKLDISSGGILFRLSDTPILPGAGPNYLEIDSTFTIKAKAGSGVFEEDIVVPARILGTGYEEVTSVGDIAPIMTITSEWP